MNRSVMSVASIYLFHIYGLFNDDVSSSNYTASNEGMIND
jgi:uncharacterized protein YwgA